LTRMCVLDYAINSIIVVGIIHITIIDSQNNHH
jgi:hypothetical protein